MPLAILFWVLMIIWLVFGFWSRRDQPFANWGGGYVLDFVLFAILGWQVFGAAIK
jgi:hypothetical protein